MEILKTNIVMKRKWIVNYIDTSSRRNVSTCHLIADCTREYVIEFFGLNNPDVEWYEIIEENINQ